MLPYFSKATGTIPRKWLHVKVFWEWRGAVADDMSGLIASDPSVFGGCGDKRLLLSKEGTYNELSPTPRWARVQSPP
jgi:hypothetical protein